MESARSKLLSPNAEAPAVDVVPPSDEENPPAKGSLNPAAGVGCANPGSVKPCSLKLCANAESVKP